MPASPARWTASRSRGLRCRQPPGGVDRHDVDAVVELLAHDVVDALDRPGVGTPAARVEELERHDLGVRGRAGDADAVVGRRGHDARRVRAVPVVVHRHAVAVHRVDAVDVVDVAVAVVVEAVAGRLAGVRPHVARRGRGAGSRRRCRCRRRPPAWPPAARPTPGRRRCGRGPTGRRGRGRREGRRRCAGSSWDTSPRRRRARRRPPRGRACRSCRSSPGRGGRRRRWRHRAARGRPWRRPSGPRPTGHAWRSRAGTRPAVVRGRRRCPAPARRGTGSTPRRCRAPEGRPPRRRSPARPGT